MYKEKTNINARERNSIATREMATVLLGNAFLREFTKKEIV